MRAIVLLLLLTLAGVSCEPIPGKVTKTESSASDEGVEWIHIEKESEFVTPDSPEQVIITLRTRDGHKWIATWEQTR